MNGVVDFSGLKGPDYALAEMKQVSFAPSISLCGQCVGTDKIGHFFEEGFDYYQIAKSKGDDKYAIGFGMWTEGLVTTDKDVVNWLTDSGVKISLATPGGMTDPMSLFGEFSVFVDSEYVNNPFVPERLREVAGRADLAANLSGLSFWKGIATKGKGFKFSICSYVTDKWDEYKNPNVKTDPRPPRH